MPTLKELMGDLTRGDGRKFARKEWDDGDWFYPMFWACDSWFGLDSKDSATSWPDYIFDDWEERIVK